MIPEPEPGRSPAGRRPQHDTGGDIRDPASLGRSLGIAVDPDPAVTRAHESFACRVPGEFLRRIRRGEPDDPLLLQVMPQAQEMRPQAGFSADPVGDLDAMVAPGVLRKYRGRALLTVTGACAIHCRYCFRRHFPYTEANPKPDAWQGALDVLRSDPSVEEIILSGGDPLTLADTPLLDLIGGLQSLPHLKRLRIHSRVPVVQPERITPALLGGLGAQGLATVLVIHVNHPRELGPGATNALASLKQHCHTMLNQSVLLRGVNDCADTLARLSEALFTRGVLPYYLHMLDPVDGAAHFAVSDPRAVQLMRALAARLPGYLVPRLVRETRGASFKQPLLYTSD